MLQKFPAPLLRSWAIRLLALLVLLGALVIGFVALHDSTLDWIRGRDRYAIAFSEIECVAPAGQERTDFLAEVQYVASMPSKLRLLDDDLAQRLAEAFALHPRVEKVERVEVLPPRRIKVQLVYRKTIALKPNPRPLP